MESTQVTGGLAQPRRRNAGAASTHLLTAKDVRMMLGSIETATTAGLHDRAMLVVMLYCFVRPGAMLRLRVKDYVREGNQRWLMLRAFAGHKRRVPVHHTAAAWLDAYLEAAGISGESKGMLFWPALAKDGSRKQPATRDDVLRTVRSLAKKAGVYKAIRCRTLRASGIALFLEAGGTVEEAKAMSGFRNLSSFLERCGL
jgi:integrase/recombinase XerC